MKSIPCEPLADVPAPIAAVVVSSSIPPTPSPTTESLAPVAVLDQSESISLEQNDPAPPVLTYEDLRAVILKIAPLPAGKEKIMALQQRYGAIDPTTQKLGLTYLAKQAYADFLKDAQAVLAGKYDPLQSNCA